MRTVPIDVPRRLEEFGYEVLLADPKDLPALIKAKLLRPEDGDVRVYTVRTPRELDRLNACDVAVYHDGRELAIFWRDSCVRLR